MEDIPGSPTLYKLEFPDSGDMEPFDLHIADTEKRLREMQNELDESREILHNLRVDIENQEAVIRDILREGKTSLPAAGHGKPLAPIR